MHTNNKLKTKRLLLRPANAADAAAIFKYRSDQITNKHQGWIPKNITDVDDFLAKISKEIDKADTWFQFVIIDINNSEIIGDLGIHFLDDKQAEIGCTLEKTNHGKGYATEALRCVIDFLFQVLNKHRVIASIDPQNVKSMELVKRLGFRKEAHFKESILINGEWFDDIVYAILKKEWKN